MIHLFMKKTKLEILAKLLQDKIITVEEFVVLSETTKEYVYYPSQPIIYKDYNKPLEVWCGTTTSRSELGAHTTTPSNIKF